MANVYELDPYAALKKYAAKPTPPYTSPVPAPHPTNFIGNQPGFQNPFSTGTAATPTSTTPPSTVGDTGHWNFPDYAALLNQMMAPLIAQTNAANTANLAGRNAGFQRAAVQFGEIPNIKEIAAALGLSKNDLGGVFTNQIQNAAQANTQAGTSTVARLGQTHDNAVRQIVNTLAARGILHSGETGYQRGQEDLNYGQGQYDARNKLLDYLFGLQSGYTTSQQQAQAALAQQQMQAALGLQGMYQPTWAGGSDGGATPPPPAGTTPPAIQYGAGSFGQPPPPSSILNSGYNWGF